MKKYLYLIVFFISIIFFIGCEEVPSEEDNHPKEEDKIVNIYFDSQGGSLIADEAIAYGTTCIEPLVNPTKNGYAFAGWSLDFSTIFDFDTKLYEDITLYALWTELYKDYSFFLDEYVPDTIESNVELPTRYEDLYLTWSTSEQSILDNYGQLASPRKDTNLTIYLEVYDDGYITYYEKDVLVKATKYKELKTSNAVFGYYSTWNFFGYTNEMKETVDVVNLSFAYVTSSNTLLTSSVASYLKRALEGHNYGIRVVLSVQGYGSEGTNFSNAASTDTGRKTLAKSMLNYVIENNLDGIDLDWEYPGFGTGRSTSVDRTNYTLLCKEIYDTFKAVDETYIISAAIPGGPYLPSRFDLTQVHKYLDYIHIMTYDMNASGKAVHHTALYAGSGTVSGCSIDESVNYYLSQGVPASKICVGAAFYGKYTTASSLGGSGGSYSSIDYTKIYNLYLNSNSTYIKEYYDEQCQAPYIIDSSNNRFITYDNERSLKAKGDYVRSKKLGGMMIWELGQDMTSLLLKSIYDNYKNLK